MARFSAIYSDEQRALVYRLRADHGLSGSAIARACAEGVQDVAAFSINRDTANRLAREEVEKRRQLDSSPVATRAQNDPRAVVVELAARLATLAGRRVDALESRPLTRPPTDAELDRAAAVVERLERVTRQLAPRPTGGKAPAASNGDKAPAAGGLLERLASEPPST